MLIRDASVRVRTRSAWLLSILFHVLLAFIYLLYPRDYNVEEEESIAVEWVKDVPPPRLRKAELKPNIEMTVYKNREVGRKARNKLSEQASNDITEVIRRSNRLVLRDVEIARADPSKVLPTIMTDAQLREAEANVARMVRLDGPVDGEGEVTGRVRARGKGKGNSLIESFGDSTEGLLGGGGDPGVADRLGLIKYLKEQEGPQRVVYCLDISASMGAAGLRKLDLAIEALKDSIGLLRDVDQFNIVTFHREVRAMKKTLLPAGVESTLEAIRYLRQFTPASIVNNRGTDILGALRLALSFKPTVVFLITDGLPAPDPRDPKRVVQDPKEILAQVQRYNVSRAKIFVVGLEVGLRNADLLVSLADQTNGRLRVISNDELIRYTQTLSK